MKLVISRRWPRSKSWLIGLALLPIALLYGSVSLSADRALAQVADLQALIDNARPSETVIVPSGVYAGPLHIDQPVTLIGEGWPVIQGSGKGDVITVTAPDVTVNGFVIRGSGDSLDTENAGITGFAPRLTVEGNRLEDVLFGVYLKEAPNSVVRDNVIRSKELETARRGDGIRVWYSADTVVEGNHVSDARDVIMWFSPNGIVRENTVERGRYGLHFMFSDNQLVEHNVMRDNSVGAFLMYGNGLTLRENLVHNNRGPSGYGVGMKDMNDVVISGNRFVNNRIGAYVDNSPLRPDSTLRFDNNLFAYNDMGVAMLPLVSRNTYASNIFQDNGEQIAIQGSGELHGNAWSEAGMGNYWSDYAGYDADGDHVGDMPYASKSLYEDLLVTHPELRLFQRSPATEALDLAAKAFPIFEPRAKMTDEHPLLEPPALPPVPGLPTAPTNVNLAAAVALIVIALLIMVAGRRRTSAAARRALATGQATYSQSG